MVRFLGICVVVHDPRMGAVSCRRGVRSDLHVCRERGGALLLLILAGSFPGFVEGSDSGWGVWRLIRY